MAELTIPGGKEKGTPISRASENSLKWWSENANNEALREACSTELQRRGGSKNGSKSTSKPAQQRQPAQQNTALATRQREAIVGSFGEASKVDAELRKASQQMHLVSPATSCASLPEGCEVALSVVYVDPNADRNGPGDVYPVPGGKLGLSGVTIKRIGAAAGVDWDMHLTGRLDNGRDPYYCHYRAVGRVRNFDGSIRTISGEVELDLRDDSPQVRAMEARANKRDGFESQLRDMRLFLVRHAETKAKLRAICDMGIRRSYNAAELTKPFAVARLMATGRSSNPQLAEKMALMNFDKLTSATATAYGPAAPHAPPTALPPAQARAPLPPFQGHDAPPVGDVADDLDDGAYDYEAEGEPAPDSGSAAEPTPPDDGLPPDQDRGPDPNSY